MAAAFLTLAGVAAAWGWSVYHVTRARQQADAHQFRAAWRHLEQAQRTWPVAADTHLLAARVARRLGLTEQARTHLEAHERLGGEAGARALDLVLLQVHEGDVAGLENDLLQMVKDRHAEADGILEALAQGYLKKNNHASLARLLPLWSDALATTCWRGKAHYYLGQFPEAIADLSPFVDRDPDWDDLRFELAQAYYRAGRSGEALAHLRYLQGRNPSPDVLLGLATCLQDQFQFNEAARVLDALLERAPDHPAALVERARVAFRLGQPQEGERWARQVVKEHPSAAEGFLVLALCLEAQSRHKEARMQQERWQALDAAQYHLGQILPELARRPDDANLQHQAGSAFLVLGNDAMGKEACERALQLDPHHRATHRLLADYYARLGQGELAKKHERAASP